MTREAIPTDISTMPDLARLAHEVARTGTRRVLKDRDVELAVLSPARSNRVRKAPGFTEAQWNAVLAAVGGWEGLVDADQLKRDLDAARSDSRPLLTL